jgi:vitamin B12 transporter
VIDLRGFRSDVDDLISVEFDPDNDPDDDFGFKAVNIDDYRNTGAEATWRWDTKTWSADLSGIVQKPKDRKADELLLRRAKRSVTAHLVRRFGLHEVGIAVLGSSQRHDVDAETGAPRIDGGYALVDLTAGIQLDGHFRLEGRIENLLDKKYQTAAGYNQPDFGGYVRLRYTW